MGVWDDREIGFEELEGFVEFEQSGVGAVSEYFFDAVVDEALSVLCCEGGGGGR